MLCAVLSRCVTKSAIAVVVWAVLCNLSPCTASQRADLAEGAQPAHRREEAFFQGLRERRLFGLARHYCELQLTKPGLQPARQANLAVQIIRAYAEEATEAPVERAQDLWNQATQAASRFTRQYPNHPRLPVVKTQGALVLLARAELITQQAAVVVNKQALLSEAGELLWQSISQLQALEKELDNSLNRASNTRQDKRWPAGQRLALLLNLRYQLARAYRIRGSTHSPQSPERSDAFNQAVAYLRPIAARESTLPIVWPARLDLVACLRLKGNLQQAAEMLSRWSETSLEPQIAVRRQEERLRLLMAQGAWSKAIALANSAKENWPRGGQQVASFDYACLELELELSQKEQPAGQSADIHRQRASRLARRIRQVHGPYWGRRARNLETLVIARSGTARDDPKMLARIAEQFYQGERFEAAVEHYERASKQATGLSQLEQAFDYGYLAAAVYHHRHQHQQASERFLRLAERFASNSRAAEAHIWGIYHTGQLAGQPDSGVSLKRYQQLLEHHLATWPRDASSDTARLWYASLLSSQGRWSLAAEQFASVNPSDPRVDQAIMGLQTAANRHLQALKAGSVDSTAATSTNPAGTTETSSSQDQPALSGRAGPWAGQVARWLARFAGSVGGNYPSNWTPQQRTAALAAAKFWLLPELADYASAGKILEAALRSDSADEVWKVAATQHFVLALAGQRRSQEAADLLMGIAQAEPADLLTLLDGLLRIAEQSPQPVRRELARLQVRAVNLLSPRRGELNASQQKLMDLAAARAKSVTAENPKEALAYYDALWKKYDSDARILEEFAVLLGQQTGQQELTRAAQLWAKLQRGSQAGSSRWFKARYHLAETYLKLGRADQAAKLIDLTRALHPEMGGAPWQSEFEKLRKRCP